MGFVSGFIFGFGAVCVIWILDGLGIMSPYRRGFRDGYETAKKDLRKKWEE